MLSELAVSAFNADRFIAALKDFSGPKRTEASTRETFARVDGRMRKVVLKFYRTTEVEEFKIWHPRDPAGFEGKQVRVIWEERNPAAKPADGICSFPTDDLLVYPNVGHGPMLEEPECWVEDVATTLALATGEANN